MTLKKVLRTCGDGVSLIFLAVMRCSLNFFAVLRCSDPPYSNESKVVDIKRLFKRSSLACLYACKLHVVGDVI